MEPSKVTSKTSSLKSLVLKAWGERWTEIQWGISIKSVNILYLNTITDYMNIICDTIVPLRVVIHQFAYDKVPVKALYITILFIYFILFFCVHRH